MNRALAAFTLTLLCTTFAQAQAVPLVVGSVRDQRGVPILGAIVTARSADGRELAVGRTGTDGTFALQAAGATRVEIRCDYCERRTLTVGAGPVIAIVHRYLALAEVALAGEDFASLPYTYAQSALSLQPFAVLDESSQILPGPQLAMRGLQSSGLFLYDGVPAYDLTTGIPALWAIPRRYLAQVTTIAPSQAYRYGDRAGGGVFALAPFGANDVAEGLGGGAAIAHAVSGGSAFGASAGYDNDAQDRRARADVTRTFTLADGEVDTSALLAQGNQTLDGDDLAGVFGGAWLHAERTRQIRSFTDASVDRGTIDADYDQLGFASRWTDMQFDAGIETLQPVHVTLGVADRESSGYYDTASGKVPQIVAHRSEPRAFAGAQYDSARFSVNAGIGAVSAYDTERGSRQRDASDVEPSLTLAWRPNAYWTLDANTFSALQLPTFLQEYAALPGISPYAERNAYLGTTLTYTDGERFRVAATTYTQRIRNGANATMSGTGASATWQIAARLSLRAWWLQLVNAPQLYGSGVPADERNAGVGSFWMSYENASRVRIDAIWRRDLLDGLPDAHVDAALSAPLTANLRWFVGTQRYLRRRSLEAGVRFESP